MNDYEEQMNPQDRPPLPVDETKRLLDLSDINLDYSESYQELDNLTKLAAHVTGSQISLVNLIDNFTQWSVAHHGIELHQMPREDSVCQYTIMDETDFEIKDLAEDERFSPKNYVAGKPHLKYYYGVPLRSSEGHNIGALCVMDQESKELDPEKIELLKLIAEEIVRRLELERKINNLETKKDELTEMVRKVSHDIRGPVGGIIGLSEILKEDASEKELQDMVDLIELIHEGSRSVLDLADDILTSASIEESGNSDQPPRANFTLPKLRDKLQNLYRPQAKSKDVTLAITVSDDHHELTFARKKLMQIIGNLISNAIKFTDTDGTVSVDLAITSNDRKHRLDARISDTGVGMSAERVEEIKNQDSISSPGTKGEKGYGFGISLVYHLVDSLDGEIEIDSTPGEGTRIHLRLPLVTG